jgi:hypothetical protein
MRIVWLATGGVVAAVGYALASLGAPQLLMFPHQTLIGQTPVYSSRPLSLEIRKIVAAADARVRTSDLFTPDVQRRPIFLTDGGPRWWLLSIGASGSFALTRPFGEAVVINRSRSDVDRAYNGAALGGERSLSGVIAHERTHILIRRRFGMFADRTLPNWKVEGYCDHVAGGGTLSDAQASTLRGLASPPRALFYYDARKRVERRLAENGGSAEALFGTD